MDCKVLIFLLAFSKVFGSNDPCKSYATIDDWSRSINNNNTLMSKCDKFLIPGWYRITSKAGEEMPTKCPKGGFTCGTTTPIWMNGTYPDTGETKNITACASHYDGDCCKNSYHIQVKNCTGYFVYYLVKTEVCPQSYCFGKELPCPKSHTSENGFSPGCRYEPCLSVNHKTMDDWHRSFGNNDTSTTICDYHLPSGWYRPISKAGISMPTSCPTDGFRCGTIEPVWLKGNLPGVNQTVNATACVSSFSRGCCSPSYDIQIRNCGDFNLYNLKSTDSCPQAYCFGSEVPCTEGWTSDTGFTPGCEFDPCYSKNHQMLSGQEKRSTNYTLDQNDKPIEDLTLQTAWYRIQSMTGNDIGMATQAMYQCGTIHPIWMKGSLPAIADKVVERKVCMTGPSVSCLIESSIKIKNCGQFRVYYLPTISYAKAAYCFGTEPFARSTITHTTDSFDVHIPWIVVVSLLLVVIILLIVLFIVKKSSRRTRQVDPPPYSLVCPVNGIQNEKISIVSAKKSTF